MRTGIGRIEGATWAALVSVGLLTSIVAAQVITGPMVGQDEKAWQTWTTAIETINRGQWEQTNAALDEVAAMGLSGLRLALMAGRTGTQLMEMGVKDQQLGQTAADLLAKIQLGTRQIKLASDGWHFAAIGKFDMADANFRAFLETGPDPVAALELAELNPNRQAILIRLVSHTQVGPAAKAMLDLMARGEKMIRTDPKRIQTNIRQLAGSPQQAYHATQKLIESGEYAVPFMLAALADPAQRDLHPVILTCLPKIGRSAVLPLCIALRTNQPGMTQLIFETLGKLGYAQAMPYVQQLLEDADAEAQVKTAARSALTQMERTSGRSVAGQDAASLFYDLGEQYYYDQGSVQADPREDIGNIWYWRDENLVSTEVPRAIFNEVMCMRCCDEALRLRPQYSDAIALWLAANFRREAQLGVASVDSEASDPALANDKTRPADFPRAIYFARAAGSTYAHMVLGRGVKDRDPAVTLGAVSALAVTAGAPNLVGAEDIKQPLVQTLTFPDLLIRVRAGLALGAALPKVKFDGSDRVVPILAEAVLLTGKRHALVIDPDQQNLNRVVGLLRDGDFTVVGEQNLLAGLNKARDELPVVDAIFLASDVAQPALAQGLSEIRRDFAFASTPVVILAKPQQTLVARRLARDDERVERELADAPADMLLAAWQRVARTAGRAELTEELAFELAMQAAEVLHSIAASNSPVYDIAPAQQALIQVLQSRDIQLQTRAASVLALFRTPDAQGAIASIALDDQAQKELRLACFASLAESGRHHGLLIGEKLVTSLIDVVMNAEDLTIRTAASAAMGALNVPGNKASEIIRAQYQG
ncbi:MAG TPA: hypothetical protein VMZ31_16470 [Phycisphaerae bacterium]|nr:hypothetical protein [Phycisphaerae bacterium]